MSTLSQFTSVIKSIQRGTITMVTPSTGVNATISTVNTAKTIVNYLGNSMDGDDSRQMARIKLTDSTTVSCNRQANIGGTIVSYEVIEYN